MEPPKEFHLFGGCMLEIPSTEELAEASRCLLLLRKFKISSSTRTAIKWDLDPDFEQMAKRDIETWKQLGVERPNHLLRPSGSIESPLAIHTYNPTYCVADPDSIVTDDPTNPMIHDLNKCGLSSKHCFMFDEICRRDATEPVIFFYTEDIRCIHRDFIRKVRRNMSAVVEICFGEHVFKEVSSSSRLIRFPLWGVFKPVRLWLELDESDPTILKRFVIHAYHPQFFYRASRLRKSGLSFDENYRKPQRLAILMAIQLADLQHQIKTESYLLSDQFAQRERISRMPIDQDLQRKENIQLALNAFKVAFPERFEQYQLRQSRTQEEKHLFNELDNLIPEPVAVKISPNEKLSEHEQILRINKRQDCLNILVKSFQRLFEDLHIFPDDGEGNEISNSEIFDFNDIPTALREWLSLQDGLKIRGKPLNSRDSLELVFSLLRQRPHPRIKQLPSEHIARMIAILYVRKVTQPQSRLRKEKCIPAEPDKVVQLKCSKCHRPVLDDAFPFVILNCPTLYVIQTIRLNDFGCGQGDCKGKGTTSLTPETRAIPRLRTPGIKGNVLHCAPQKDPELEGSYVTHR